MMLWKKITELEVTKRLLRKQRKLFLSTRALGMKGSGSSGWVLDGTSVDQCESTLAASLTSCKLIIPVTNVFPGDVIREAYLSGRVESAGQNVVIAFELRRMRAVADDNTDTQIVTRTLTTLTADAVLEESNSAIFMPDGTTTVKDGDLFYLVVTGTTGTSTAIELTHAVVVVDQA